MRNYLLLTTLLASLAARRLRANRMRRRHHRARRRCVPSDVDVDPPMCGPFTELAGDRCVPMFQPTECDPATTEASIDPDTGIVTCIGTGAAVDVTQRWPASSADGGSKLTICGQLYDFETTSKFQSTDMPTGTQCDPSSADRVGAVRADNPRVRRARVRQRIQTMAQSDVRYGHLHRRLRSLPRR